MWERGSDGGGSAKYLGLMGSRHGLGGTGQMFAWFPSFAYDGGLRAVGEM